MRRVLHISLVALLGLVLFRPAVAQIAITVAFGPPALPVYEQPLCPGEGFMWVPGYWAWDADGDDYYWVPGTWVEAPQPGLLWTPAWWGWEDGFYRFHDGYWATEVGWYGGINYGFGYWGHGFWGGRWDHDRFFYNTAVVRVNETVIRNVYIDKTVIINNRVENRVSYNGGQGGITERPTPQEERVASMQHFPPARPQMERREMARSNPELHAKANQGKPPIAATQRPTEFKGPGVVAAREAGAPYHPPAGRSGEAGRTAEPGGTPNGPPAMQPGHARDLQPHQPASPENQKLIDKQNKDHEKLAAKQQKEDDKATKQNWNDQRKQQLEQHHQQQTQQVEQRHQQQTQRAQPKPNQRPQ